MRTLEEVRKDLRTLGDRVFYGELDEAAMEEARRAYNVLKDEELELERLREIEREGIETLSRTFSSSFSLF